jgi:hypothetical protein
MALLLAFYLGVLCGAGVATVLWYSSHPTPSTWHSLRPPAKWSLIAGGKR